MRECFLLLAHCDSEKRLSCLSNSLDFLITTGIDICVFSSLPVPIDLQNKIKYYIYDNENPIFDISIKTQSRWRTDLRSNIKMTLNRGDPGFALALKYKKAFEFLSPLYDIIHMADYDIVFKDVSFLNEIRSHYKPNVDGVLLYGGSDSIATYFMSFSNNCKFLKSINSEEYLRFPILEYYMTDLITKSNLKFITYQEDEFKERIGDSYEDFFSIFNYNHFKIHIGEQIQRDIRTNLIGILLFTIKRPINIAAEINNRTYNLSGYSKDHFLINTNIIVDDFRNNNYKISIKIDDIEIPDTSIQKFKYSTLEHI